MLPVVTILLSMRTRRKGSAGSQINRVNRQRIVDQKVSQLASSPAAGVAARIAGLERPLINASQVYFYRQRSRCRAESRYRSVRRLALFLPSGGGRCVIPGTSEAFCCVTRSISKRPKRPGSIPRLYIRRREVISPMISVTRVTALTMSVMVSRRFPPALNRYRHETESSINALFLSPPGAAVYQITHPRSPRPQNRAPRAPLHRSQFSARMLKSEGNTVDNAG